MSIPFDVWDVRVAAALMLLLATGCVGGQADTSAECLTAMETAAAEPDSAKANPLIVETLRVCPDADQWLAALREHPAAMGLNERAEIGPVSLLAACGNATNTPVCTNARERGMLD
jgi:hypothetical protein